MYENIVQKDMNKFYEYKLFDKLWKYPIFQKETYNCPGQWNVGKVKVFSSSLMAP